MSELTDYTQGREESGYKRDHFDIQRGSLDGLVGVLQSRPTTVQESMKLVGITTTFIVQTIRHTDDGKSRDFIFVQFIGPEGAQRFVLPPKVAETIARQRAALVKRSASRRGREQAAARKAAGKEPAFLKRKKKGTKRGGRAARS